MLSALMNREILKRTKNFLFRSPPSRAEKKTFRRNGPREEVLAVKFSIRFDSILEYFFEPNALIRFSLSSIRTSTERFEFALSTQPAHPPPQLRAFLIIN